MQDDVVVDRVIAGRNKEPILFDEPGGPPGRNNLQPGAVLADVDGRSGGQRERVPERLGHDDSSGRVTTGPADHGRPCAVSASAGGERRDSGRSEQRVGTPAASENADPDHSGEGGIRTHGPLQDTRFPVVPIRPLSHPSGRQAIVDGTSGVPCGGWDLRNINP